MAFVHDGLADDPTLSSYTHDSRPLVNGFLSRRDDVGGENGEGLRKSIARPSPADSIRSAHMYTTINKRTDGSGNTPTPSRVPNWQLPSRATREGKWIAGVEWLTFSLSLVREKVLSYVGSPWEFDTSGLARYPLPFASCRRLVPHPSTTPTSSDGRLLLLPPWKKRVTWVE